MIPLLTAQDMRDLEADAIQGWGVPSLVLQEHAALGALDLLPASGPLHVLAGPGNNGGDALALARLARLRGRAVDVWVLEGVPAWKGDAALQARLWEGIGGTYRMADHPQAAVEGFAGWVVDGLFGLGARPPLRGAAAAWAGALAGHPRILALDLPSGLDPSAAEVPGPVIPAARTAAFGRLKVCHGLRPARDLCGAISVVPIPLRGEGPCALRLLEAPAPRAPRWDTHKGEAGHLAIRAGSRGMAGAAVLAALGALRMGAGLVTVFCDAEVRAEVAGQVPEAMVRPWEGALPAGFTALVAGPGGIAEVPAWEGPLVLDASALQPGEGPRWLARPGTVLTPHPGEFNRLFPGAAPLGRGPDARIARVREVADGPGVLVLKGAQTLVAGGGLAEVWANPTGHPGLGTGGAGDFLAGMVGARGAQAAAAGGDLRAAAAEAVWLHGAAADRLGPGPILIRELGEALAALLRTLHGGPHD
ncbi:NAD(P)H-hydrate dehydratase [Mesoterricola sediminis]|uniref:Bifunctional NAD(P)H-hydrate repair enzyme n=1 Tax=Mesoterricola sediminis TaxID=2927980 RepID=A0AA48GT93_9BACT|nr:NAD(P)H-hydrate dehydratase [Mesoterricola sediminis]BDU77289.1 bifunctional NAD(P)H-hydrate repair enzyme [Mesoterricola sediminis]